MVGVEMKQIVSIVKPFLAERVVAAIAGKQVEEISRRQRSYVVYGLTRFQKRCKIDDILEAVHLVELERPDHLFDIRN